MGLFGSKEEKEEKKAKKEEEKQEFEARHGKKITFLVGKYVGGNLTIKANENIEIVCYEKDIALHPANSLWMHNKDIFIPYDKLEPLNLKTEEQIEKDVTLTRLLLVGVLAFGLKKKKVTRSQFLIISGIDETGSSISGIFEIGSTSSRNITRINEVRRNFLINKPSEIQEEVAIEEVPVVVADPIEQIKKLAELKQIGAITEEEFEAKKSELLSRV
jgi:hypothetical protein